MKKLLAILLAAIMVFSFAACGEKKQQEVAEEPKVLTVATKGNPVGLCPLVVTVASANTPAQSYIFDRLFEFDAATGSSVPMLATDYEFVDDTHIRLTIRDDVYAYDGTTKFTAKDVAFSFKKACDKNVAARYWNNYFTGNCTVEDDTHVVIELTKFDSYVPTALSNIPYGLSVESLWTTDDEQSLLPTAGTGPYYVKEWSQDSYILLAKNEHYWGKEPYYDEIKLLIMTDPSARVMALESGEVDICLDPGTTDVAKYYKEKVPGITVVSEPTSNNHTLFLNNQKAPFDDVHARRAFALALDYENNVKIAVSGLGIAPDSILPKTNKYYVKPTTSYYHYDLAAAKEEWAQSKYAGKEFNIEVSFSDNWAEAYATLIMQQWHEIDEKITVTPKLMDATAFHEYIANGQHDAEIINNSSPDPQSQYTFYDFRKDFKAVQGGAGCAEIPGFVEKLDAAKATLDEAERAKLYGEIQQILDDYVPSIPLYIPTKTCLTNDEVKGIILTTVGDINTSLVYE